MYVFHRLKISANNI